MRARPRRWRLRGGIMNSPPGCSSPMMFIIRDGGWCSVEMQQQRGTGCQQSVGRDDGDGQQRFAKVATMR